MKFKIIYIKGLHCGACKMQGLIVDTLKTEYPNIEWVTYMAEDYMELCQKLNIASVPALIFLVDGKIKEIKQGLVPRPKFQQIIHKWFVES